MTLVLVQQRAKLAEVLDVAPAALGNLARAYNPDFGTLDTRDNGLGSLNAEIVVCGALAQARPGRPDARPPGADPSPTRTAPAPDRHRADLRPAALRRRRTPTAPTT